MTEPETARTPWRTRLRWGIMVLLLMGTAALLLGANSWKRTLNVSSVVVHGTSLVGTPEILAVAQVTRGTPLFSLDLGLVKRRLEQHPYVSCASVQRDTPDRITIVITEREPIAVVLASQPVYLDSSGFVLPAVRSDHVFDLPVITGAVPSADLVPGRRVATAALRWTVLLLNTAREIGEETERRISEVHLQENGDLILYAAEYGIPVIVDTADIAGGLLRLDGFWKDVVGRYGAQGLQYVDLRFKDQVVVRWSKQPGGQ